MTKIEKIKKLAWIVRRAYESMAYTESDLAGECFSASKQLFKLAKDNNIDIEIGMNKFEHAFCLLNNTVVDVTATQFGKFPKVMIRSLNQLIEQKCTDCYPWKITGRYNTIKSANRAFEYSGNDKRERKTVLEFAAKMR